MKNFSILERISRLDYIVLTLVITLSMSGIAILYSAAGGNMSPWASSQMYKVLPMFFIMLIIAMFIPIRWLLRYSYLFYALCVLLLVFVEIAGHIGMGAQRWLRLGGVNIQPSEITKIAVIMALARYFHNAHSDSLKSPIFLLPALIMLAIPTILILKQPNLGTATVLATIGIMIFFVAGVAWRYFIGLLLIVAISAPIGWQFLHSYQKQRIITFLDPQQDPQGAGYNVIQSMIAIGSGGLDGKGYLNGSQGQLDFLPEKQTDFVFTMLAEEFGFIGSTIILFMFSLLIMRCYLIAVSCKNRYGAFLCVGVGSMLFLHIFINVGMSMGILPVVGVPLPFLSYGGSMMIATMIGIGLAMNVHINKNVEIRAHDIRINR